MPDSNGSDSSAIDIDALQAWLGRQETRTDVISPTPLAGLSATLDYTVPRAGVGDRLPEGWHWLYFLPTPPAAAIDVDGHARRGDFLPAVPLPRRMWAGSRIHFLSELRVGDEIRRVSSISDISHKHGASGELVFVGVRHRIFCTDRLAIEEEQQLVYRGHSVPGASSPARPAPAQPQWSRELRPDPVLLFRYSALTFNSHRIHYDLDYATTGEGYPGLVVQGPLTATLLLDLVHRELPGKQLETFQFSAVRPAFAGEPLLLQGRCDGPAIRLWALDGAGALVMDARAQLR